MESKSVLPCIAIALLLPILTSASAAAQTLDKVKAVIPQNSVFVLNWKGAKDAGVFTKHGIDLDVDVRPFAGYPRQPARQADHGDDLFGHRSHREDERGAGLAVIGGGLTVIQEVFVRKDSPIKTIADLRGKKFGVWSTGAGAFKAARAAMIGCRRRRRRKDAKLVQLAPPALVQVAGAGRRSTPCSTSAPSPSTRLRSRTSIRPIFSPNDYWKKKTGYPIVWSAPLVAWKELGRGESDPSQELRRGDRRIVSMAEKPENFDAAVKKYGTLAGVTHPEAMAVYKKWLGREEHLPGALGSEGRRCASGSSWNWPRSTAS